MSIKPSKVSYYSLESI